MTDKRKNAAEAMTCMECMMAGTFVGERGNASADGEKDVVNEGLLYICFSDQCADLIKQKSFQFGPASYARGD